MTELTREPIDVAAVLDSVRSPSCGAVVLFLGTVREFTGGRQTVRLGYEAYPVMAEAKMADLESEARGRWALHEVRIVHRLGTLELADVSVAVAVSSPHRLDSFEAAGWLIDRLKEVVPIWKQEHWADGSMEWVHPGMPSTAEPADRPPN